MSKLILTDQNFQEEVLKSAKPVLVDFWADWCVPCQMIAPTIDELAEEFKENVKVGKLNVDENPLTAATFMVDILPTLALFKNGKIVKKFTGVQPKEIILNAITFVVNDKS